MCNEALKLIQKSAHEIALYKIQHKKNNKILKGERIHIVEHNF